jgi:hypothetical protein
MKSLNHKQYILNLSKVRKLAKLTRAYFGKQSNIIKLEEDDSIHYNWIIDEYLYAIRLVQDDIYLTLVKMDECDREELFTKRIEEISEEISEYEFFVKFVYEKILSEISEKNKRSLKI